MSEEIWWRKLPEYEKLMLAIGRPMTYKIIEERIKEFIEALLDSDELRDYFCDGCEKINPEDYEPEPRENEGYL
jgi:hypothetical protein